MSYIACTDPCVYQQDGYCSLARAASFGMPSEETRCVNFVPKRKSSQKDGQRLADVGNLNEL